MTLVHQRVAEGGGIRSPMHGPVGAGFMGERRKRTTQGRPCVGVRS